MSAGSDTPPPLHRRLLRRRIEAAVADRGTSLALGAVILVSAAAYVLGARGVIGSGAWLAGLAAGGAFVVVRASLGFFDRRKDPDLLREVLANHFGEEIRFDREVTRLSRQAIEQRLQLATACAEAPSPMGHSANRLLAALDRRLDTIAIEARAATSHRGAARFQAGMAQLARQRLTEVALIADAAEPDRAASARKAVDGLAAQVVASGGVVTHAEDRLIALDQAVAEFGTTVAQALLAISRRDHSALDALANGLASRS